MLPDKIAFVDVETTGGSLRGDRVIEIGVVRIENNKIVKEFKTLINPERYLPEEITLLTGITKHELEGSPTFSDIKEQLLEIMDDCVMVAHNVRFDYSFLKNEFKLFGIEFSPKHFCTVKLSRALFPSMHRHNLDAIIDHFKLECPQRHRAFDDALVLWQFYQKVLDQFPEAVLVDAIKKGMKSPTVPLNIDKGIIDALPETSGVYIFYGENGLPLYIGKSVNIKKRVQSHFSSDHLSSFELKISQQVKSIEAIQTPGELSALFKESTLIKEMQPLYNRKLRLSRTIYYLKSFYDKNGYKSTKIERASEIDIQDLDNFLGVFKNQRSIKELLIHLAKEHQLCEKLLGIEKTKGACFGYRLGKCNGGCTGQEDFENYNKRFEEAVQSIRVKPWPFKGTIMITETDNLQQQGEGYLFDRWCFLGKLSFDEWGSSSSLERDVKFDLDLYKILDGFIRSPKAKRMVKEVNLNQLSFQFT